MKYPSLIEPGSAPWMVEIPAGLAVFHGLFTTGTYHQAPFGIRVPRGRAPRQLPCELAPAPGSQLRQPPGRQRARGERMRTWA